ncbi:MAG: hypothetical protein U5J98_09190 [Halobacteriales archaeon]|nr:hypothetical protein [Halobacteriales archaeon]
MAFMSTTLLAASALSAVNVVLLAALSVVWLRNYRTFRTPMVLGLVAFALVLLIENLTALFFFFDMRMLFAADPRVHQAVVVLRALEFVALSFLTYVTMK